MLVELTVTVININHPDNEEFLDNCPILKGYKKLLATIKEYKRIDNTNGYTMEIEKCIRDNMKISDYLRRKTMEVRNMFSVDMFSLEYKYSEELEAQKSAGIQEGRQEGMQKGIITIACNMKKSGYSIQEIQKISGLSSTQIEKL